MSARGRVNGALMEVTRETGEDEAQTIGSRTNAVTSARMRRTRRRDTSAELALRRELHRRGLRYFVDRPPLKVDRRRRADIVFPSARVAIYVDGCFWHGCPTHGTWPKTNAPWWREKIERNRARDRSTNEALREAGWTVLRVWEHEDPGAAANRVEKAVRLASASTNNPRHAK
jgi:DNA mismatch endonuclease (patch repair protein)